MRNFKKKIKIEVTFQQVMESSLLGAWEDMCKKYGIDEWCISDGRAKDDDTVEITLQDAESYGIIGIAGHETNETS